jgi:hypothetical protein
MSALSSISGSEILRKWFGAATRKRHPHIGDGLRIGAAGLKWPGERIRLNPHVGKDFLVGDLQIGHAFLGADLFPF